MLGIGLGINKAQSLKVPQGLLFYADYERGTLTPIYAVGSKAYTFTAARDALHPASYYDSNGVLQFKTNNNTPRFVGGYRDETGFHILKGLAINSASTNLCKYSNDLTKAVWVQDEPEEGAMLIEPNSEISPDGTMNATRLTVLLGDALIKQSIISSSNKHVFSLNLKALNGTTTLARISVNGGVNWTLCNVSTEWRTFYTYPETTPFTCKNPKLMIQMGAVGDTMAVYGCQCEAGRITPTPLLLTTNVELTRNIETLKYACLNNRSAEKETVFISFTPSYFVTAGQQINAPAGLIGNDGDERYVYVGSQNGDAWVANSNVTDNPKSYAGAYSQGISRFATKHICCVFNKGTSPYVKVYVNGVLKATETADDFTANDFGSWFYIGKYLTTYGDSSCFNGVVHKVAIFNRVLSDSEISDLSVKGLGL